MYHEEYKNIQCCGENIWLINAKYHKKFPGDSLGASIFMCAKCQKTSKVPCFSTLGIKSLLEMLTNDWNEKEPELIPRIN